MLVRHPNLKPQFSDLGRCECLLILLDNYLTSDIFVITKFHVHFWHEVDISRPFSRQFINMRIEVQE